MAIVRRQRYSAAIAGSTVTLTADANFPTEPHDQGISTVVITTVANPANPTFWEAAAKGARYLIRIEKVY